MSSESLINQSQIANTIQSISGITLDANRVRAVLDLVEGDAKPNLVLTLTDSAGKEVSRSLIMGNMSNHLEFTLHIRIAEPSLPLTLRGITYLEEEQPIDTKSCLVTMIT